MSSIAVIHLLAQTSSAPPAPLPPSTPSTSSGPQIPVFLLSALIWTTAIGALVIWFMPERTPDQRSRIRLVALTATAVSLALAVFAINDQVGNDAGGLSSTLMEKHLWIGAFSVSSVYHLDVDGLALPLLVLSTLAFVAVALSSWKIDEEIRRFSILVLLLATGVNGLLCAQDYLLFLAFSAMQLLPLFLLISGWGGRRAANKQLAIGLTSSALLIVAVLLMVVIASRAGHATFDLSEVNSQNLEEHSSGLAACAFWLGLAAFALVLGVVPVHTWLVDVMDTSAAPVAMLVGGVISKLGGYAMLRVILGAFPGMAHRYSLVIVGFAALTTLWGLVGALGERQLGRQLGYVTVGQSGAVLLAVGSQSTIALGGAVFQLVAQGLAIGVLVLVAGAIRERVRTGDATNMGGLVSQAPGLAWLWLVAALSALGAPLLAGFNADVMLFTGAFPAHRVATVVVLSSLILTSGVLLLSMQRIFLGPAREIFRRVKDATALELTYVAPLLAGLVFFGLVGGRVVPLIAKGVGPIARQLSGG